MMLCDEKNGVNKCNNSKPIKETGGPGIIGKTEPINPSINNITENMTIKVVISQK